MLKFSYCLTRSNRGVDGPNKFAESHGRSPPPRVNMISGKYPCAVDSSIQRGTFLNYLLSSMTSTFDLKPDLLR